VKRFAFRLERLRRLREVAEREKAKALGEAMKAEDEKKVALDASIAKRDRAREQVSEASNTASCPLAAGTLANLGLVADTFGATAEEAETAYRAAEENTETERKGFLEARKDRRILDRLKERRKNDWMYEVSRAEQATTDEAASRAGNTVAGGNQ